jgi:hypothetical protein
LKAAARRQKDQAAANKPVARSLEQFAGRYENPAYGVVAVTHRDGVLHWEWSGFRGLLNHQGGEEFAVLDENLADNSLEFQIKDSRVVALRFLNLQFQRQGP